MQRGVVRGNELRTWAQQSRRWRVTVVVLMLALVTPICGDALGVLAAPAAAAPVPAPAPAAAGNGYDYTLRVNDVRLIPDANPGDGKCETATNYGAGCTLLAAAQESNALSDVDPTVKVLVTLAAPTASGSIRQLDGSFANSGTVLLENSAANTPTGFTGMIRGSAAMNSIVGGTVDNDHVGSILWFSGSVVVDLQNRLDVTPLGDGGMTGTLVSFTGQDQVLRNFSNLVSAEGVIYVGKTAKNLLIEKGSIANGPAGSGGLTYAIERAINVIGGSEATVIREVTMDSIWAGGITFIQQSGNTAEPVHGLSLIDSTFSWENRYTGNAVYGIGKWDGSVSRVDDLVITGTTFRDFRRGTHYDNSVPISGDLIQLGGVSRISGNRFVNTLEPSLIHSGVNNDIRLPRAPLAGATVSIDHNVFSNETSWVPTGPAVLVSGGTAAFGTVAVTDNAFFGWNRGTTGQVISIASSGGPAVAVDRNTFSGVGGYTETPTNSAELPGNSANPVYLSNVNSNVRTAFPSGAAALPDTCQVRVTVQRPQAGGVQPTYPVRVDAFAGGSSGTDHYLGGVLVASDADLGLAGAELSYPYSLDGGKLRLQTVDALGNTSPLSRTVEVTGANACGPQLWIRQADTQEDPTWSRLQQFEVMSSEPLADGALEAALNLEGSSTSGEVVSVQAVSGDSSANSRWSVTVHADAAGTIVLGAAANSVQDRSGHSNALAANASDAPNNFVRSTDPAGVAGTPGSQLDNAVTYRLPVSLSAPASGTLTATEGEAAHESFTIGLDARDALDRTIYAPIASIAVQANWANLVADASLPDPVGDPAAQATLPPNNAAMSESEAVMDPAARETRVAVAAVDNTVVDGTRTVTFTPVLASDDPEYDGLVLDALTITVADNDDPVAANSSVASTSNNAVANGTSANRVTATVRNAAGQAVQNATTHFDIPDELISLNGDDPAAGPTRVTEITNAQGEATLAVGSTVARTDFPVSVLVNTGGGEDPVTGSPVKSRFVPGPASAAHSVLSVSSGVHPVDGEPHSASVLVADAFGNFVSDQTVVFATEQDTVLSDDGIATSGSDGVARVTVRTRLAEEVAVSAALGGEEVASSPAVLTFGAGSYSAANSGVRAVSEVAEANGKHKVLLEARLKDAYGNFIRDELSGVSILTSIGEVTTTEYAGEGVYTTTLSAATPGTARASVSVGGVVAAGTAEVRFVPTPKRPTVDPSNGTRVAGSAESLRTVTVRTEDGELIATTTVDFFGRFSTALSVAVEHDQKLRVQALDENGFASPEANLTIDLIAPDAPKADPSNGWQLNICAEEGSSIVVRNKFGNLINGVLGKVREGCAVFTPSVRLTESDGVRVYAVDVAGNQSEAFVPFIKTTLPAAPDPDPSNGIIIAGGTIEQTDSIQFLDGKGQRLKGTIAIDDRGLFTFTPSPRLVTGDEVVLRVTDPVGNSIEVPVAIESTPPIPAVVSSFTSQIVTGYAEPGATVTVTDKDGALLGTAVAGLDGYFEIALSLAPTRNEVITLLVTDTLGNESEALHLRLSAASVMVERPVLANGDTQTVHGFGYVPGERVTATLESSAVEPVSGVTDASGHVSLEITLDATVELGQHTIMVAGAETSLRSESFTVAEHRVFSLANTGIGGPGLAVIVLSALALLTGAAAVVRGSRRSSLKTQA